MYKQGLSYFEWSPVACSKRSNYKAPEFGRLLHVFSLKFPYFFNSFTILDSKVSVYDVQLLSIYFTQKNKEKLVSYLFDTKETWVEYCSIS